MIYKNMKISFIIVFFFLLTSCTTTTQTEPVKTFTSVAVSGTLTPIPSKSPTLSVTPSPIIQKIEVTRIYFAVRTVVVTPTSAPILAQECFAQAMTQAAMNGCAAEAHSIAEVNLENIMAQINLSVVDKTALEQLNIEWKNLSQKDCEFFYGRSVTDNNGFSHYERGSMAPMLVSMCLADSIEKRINDLTIAYLQNNGG
jgi:uncharacterized protein YecT (DUF1311 family)